MKKFLFLVIGLFLSFRAISYAQKSIDLQFNEYHTRLTSIVEEDDYYQFDNLWHIGYVSLSTDAWRWYHSAYKFNFNTIPSNATISKVTLTCSLSVNDNGVNHDVRLKYLPNDVNLNDAESIWKAIGWSGDYNLTFKYNDTLITDITNEIINRLSTGYIIIGAFEEGSSYENSLAKIDLKIKVEYYDPFSIDVKNNFDGGGMYINSDVQTTSVPYTLQNSKSGDVYKLKTYTQTDNTGYDRVWNSNHLNNISEWSKKDNLGNSVELPNNKDYYYFINVDHTDYNATYTANYRKAYRIARNDQTESDGTIQRGVVTSIVEQNSGNVPLPNFN